MREQKPQPFAPFGQALKQLRQKTKETEVEVSGAVEIDHTKLRSYELGETRPTEDVLMLLIRHFDLKDNAATELWRLAGYGDTMPDDEAHYFIHDDFGDVHGAQPVGIMPEDARVVYTDMVQVMVNNYGVIVNFMQGAGPGNGPLAVSRIGMSKEHARSIVEVLSTTLDQATELEKKAKQKTPRHLPSGSRQKPKK